MVKNFCPTGTKAGNPPDCSYLRGTLRLVNLAIFLPHFRLSGRYGRVNFECIFSNVKQGTE